jgi:hypothetical protein
MKKVVLITTGDCEQLALGASLKRYFPGAEFEALPRRESFTSSRVRASASRPIGPRSLSTVVDRLAQAMIAVTDPGRDGTRPDLVIAVDDVEVVNLDQLDVVVAQLRQAVQRHLETFPWPSARRCEQVTERLREHCSFHLLCPMVEAYFYGEAGALQRAGARRPSKVDALNIDVEDFATADEDFLSVPDGKTYWAKSNRQKHPKRYLEYLCDPEGSPESAKFAYRETGGGVSALQRLDWSGSFSLENRAQLARSLFADLALALDVENPFPGSCHPLTSQPGRDAILRNL